MSLPELKLTRAASAAHLLLGATLPEVRLSERHITTHCRGRSAGIMLSRSNERFVADGGFRWWQSPEGTEVREQIEAEVRSRYQAELRRAGWFKETFLEFRIQREVDAECARVLWARR